MKSLPDPRGISAEIEKHDTPHGYASVPEPIPPQVAHAQPVTVDDPQTGTSTRSDGVGTPVYATDEQRRRIMVGLTTASDSLRDQITPRLKFDLTVSDAWWLLEWIAAHPEPVHTTPED